MSLRAQGWRTKAWPNPVSPKPIPPLRFNATRPAASHYNVLSCPSEPTQRLVQIADTATIDITTIRTSNDFPAGTSRADFVAFLAEHLEPYGDPPHHIDAAIEYAFSDSDGRGGFLLAATEGDDLVGAMIVNDTGMSGFIPEHILVYVAVDGSRRGKGIGSKLMDAMQAECTGDVALHVEHDNPARRLYERLGFTSKYAEMRLHR
jgi:[ribosomal protein S18]-alanine N-acetyltransferase